MAVAPVAKIEREDTQALVFSGFGTQKRAAFVLLQIGSPAAARVWIADLLHRKAIRHGDDRDGRTTVQLAFTAQGLARLGLGDDELQTFPRELQEGMSGFPDRSRILGDTDASDPTNWLWGGRGRDEPMHALLMLYGDDESFARLDERETRAYELAGLRRWYRRDSLALDKEHFGFVDGISNVKLAGAEMKVRKGPGSEVAAGEFLLGYPNEYGKLPFMPHVAEARDRASVLSGRDVRPGRRALGRNGTYLVFRHLAQDVPGFWRAMAEATRRADGTPDPAAAELLAAKCVGRWKNGAPLAKWPTEPPASVPAAELNDFGFAKDDAHGYGCPLGAHIRRANPRDALPPLDPVQSQQIVNRHRLLRRGRTYGPTYEQAPDDDDRGLAFICLNASIRRQFEFVQQTWLANSKFGGLYEDSDPIVLGGTITQQARPVRRRTVGLPRFVHVRGGGYFFLPGLSALRFLASL